MAIPLRFDSIVDAKAVKIAGVIDAPSQSLLHVLDRSITAGRLVASS
jgi:hypothetical protein